MSTIDGGKTTASGTAEGLPGSGSVTGAATPKPALVGFDRVTRVERANVEEPGQRKTRVLVANEPRSYREVMAIALQELVPNIDARIVEPEALEREVARLAPDLVICSRATETMRNADLSWISLYPGSSNHAVFSIRGRRWRVPEPTPKHIIAAIDEVKRPPNRDLSGSV